MRFNSRVLNNVLDILTELCNRNMMPEFGGRKAGIVGTETNSQYPHFGLCYTWNELWENFKGLSRVISAQSSIDDIKAPNVIILKSCSKPEAVLLIKRHLSERITEENELIIRLRHLGRSLAYTSHSCIRSR